MNRTLLALVAILWCVPFSQASADSMTTETLVNICRGNERKAKELLRLSMAETGVKSVSKEFEEKFLSEQREEAKLVCAMYLAGALDQIIFFFDKDGLFEELRAICIPRSFYENPSSLRDMVIHKLQNMPPTELASVGKNTAKFWIATTMLKLFPCSEAGTPAR